MLFHPLAIYHTSTIVYGTCIYIYLLSLQTRVWKLGTSLSTPSPLKIIYGSPWGVKFLF